MRSQFETPIAVIIIISLFLVLIQFTLTLAFATPIKHISPRSLITSD